MLAYFDLIPISPSPSLSHLAQSKSYAIKKGSTKIRLQKPQLVSDCPTKCAVNRTGKGGEGRRVAPLC